MLTENDFGKKIIMKRLISILEKEGYRVESAPDYEGYIVADKREDPNIFLLSNQMIEQIRVSNAGNTVAFLNAVLDLVKANLTAGTASVPPPGSVAASQSYSENIPPPISPPPITASPYPERSNINLQPALQSNTDFLDQENDDVEEISGIIEEENLKH